jgi:hypothetical protein
MSKHVATGNYTVQLRVIYLTVYTGLWVVLFKFFCSSLAFFVPLFFSFLFVYSPSSPYRRRLTHGSENPRPATDFGHSWVPCVSLWGKTLPHLRVGSGWLASGIRWVAAEITYIHVSACYCWQPHIAQSGPGTSGAKFKNLDRKSVV